MPNKVITVNSNSTANGQQTFMSPITVSNSSNPGFYTTISNTNTTNYEIVTQNGMKNSLYKAFNEMSKEDCAKILYACLSKLVSDEKREELETLLKMCNDYQTVIKQIIKI